MFTDIRVYLDLHDLGYISEEERILRSFYASS